MNENKIKHLEFIQAVITRMAQNSFFLKGWSVTILVGIFAFANVSEMDSRYLIVAYIPVVFFWFLDGFFLWQEKLYRKLYDRVRGREEEAIDYNMNAYVCKDEVKSWLKVTFSTTLSLFYIPLLVVILLAMLIFPS
ncbi:hypothetical protein CEQ83_26570 (plasmid) [Priestia megaterium]|uniref:hypothetical protein n=1 Tax=Priestia megaterium TaxID=1404 RepID=UPI0012AA7ADF|nr:hypothetical protein [Priestia megaterium]QFY76107.1 hypothetical protein CEQ83_26570 [Priestia megaterium]